MAYWHSIILTAAINAASRNQQTNRKPPNTHHLLSNPDPGAFKYRQYSVIYTVDIDIL